MDFRSWTNIFILFFLLLSSTKSYQVPTCTSLYTTTITHPSCSPVTPDRQYWYLSILGSGSASSVIKAIPITRVQSYHPQPSASKFVAIKIFDRAPAHGDADEYISNIWSEFDTIRFFQHQNTPPNIVRAYDLIEHGERFFMVMEYCESTLIKELEKGRLAQDDVEWIWFGIVETVWIMHGHGFAHRDLKLENVLVCAGGRGTGGKDVFKLGDFGSARKFRGMNGEEFRESDVEGTEPYLAPELNRSPLQPYRADIADIWQLGILFVAMTLGRYPWLVAEETDPGYEAYLNNPESLIDKLPERARKVIRGMLEVDEKKRWRWDQIQTDAWAHGACCI